MGAPVVGTGAETIADALWLGEAELVPAGLVLAELAAGVPDEHAARDRLAAQAARASAAERYLFIRFLYWVHKSQVPTLNAPTIRRARFDREPWQALRCAALSPRPVRLIYLNAC
jgi:hypothetical protein